MLLQTSQRFRAIRADISVVQNHQFHRFARSDLVWLRLCDWHVRLLCYRDAMLAPVFPQSFPSGYVVEIGFDF